MSRTISVSCPYCGCRHAGLLAVGGVAEAPCGARFSNDCVPIAAPPVRDPRSLEDVFRRRPAIEIKGSEAMREAEFTINVRFRFDRRFRLGLWLVRLGFRVMGVRRPVEVKRSHADPPPG